MEIYVGNLPWSVRSEPAEAFGPMELSKSISGHIPWFWQIEGFGFVTMNNDDEANKAIEAMNGQEMVDHWVNEARPMEEILPKFWLVNLLPNSFKSPLSGLFFASLASENLIVCILLGFLQENFRYLQTRHLFSVVLTFASTVLLKL